MEKEISKFYVCHYDDGSDRVFYRELKPYEKLEAKVIIEHDDSKWTVIKGRFGEQVEKAYGKLEWMEEDLRTAKQNIEDLQEEIDKIKHLLDAKGISF